MPENRHRGAHYAVDVMGGRILALYDLAQLYANDPASPAGLIKLDGLPNPRLSRLSIAFLDILGLKVLIGSEENEISHSLFAARIVQPGGECRQALDLI